MAWQEHSDTNQLCAESRSLFMNKSLHLRSRKTSMSLPSMPLRRISYVPSSSRFDAYATHFLLKLVPSQTPIGTIRMHKPLDAPYCKLTRLAVLKEYRKHRLGAALVQRAHQFVLHDHANSGLAVPVEVIAHSQIPAKSFYERWPFCSWTLQSD
jgi:GNAT superfamily N-acetyltransferase